MSLVDHNSVTQKMGKGLTGQYWLCMSNMGRQIGIVILPEKS